MERKIIDFHMHMFPDYLAERALKRLLSTPAQRAASGDSTDGTEASTTAYLRSLGISRACLMNIATKPQQQRTINAWAATLNREFYIPFGAIHPRSSDVDAELERIVAYGFPGIKLHPVFQGFHVLENVFLELCAKCEQLGLIVLLHGGGDRYHPENVSGHPQDTALVRKMFPELKLVLAHFGCQRRWDLAEQYTIGQEVYIDISHTVGLLSEADARRMIFKHPQEYILFGSDCPLQNTERALAFFRRLQLPENLAEDILYGNAARLLGSALTR